MPLSLHATFLPALPITRHLFCSRSLQRRTQQVSGSGRARSKVWMMPGFVSTLGENAVQTEVSPRRGSRAGVVLAPALARRGIRLRPTRKAGAIRICSDRSTEKLSGRPPSPEGLASTKTAAGSQAGCSRTGVMWPRQPSPGGGRAARADESTVLARTLVRVVDGGATASDCI